MDQLKRSSSRSTPRARRRRTRLDPVVHARRGLGLDADDRVLRLYCHNWWATWYPGAEPGGGGYIAQRIFSAKDEKHSLLATLWFNVAHYAIRPWPWVLTALAVAVLYPDAEGQGDGLHQDDVDPDVLPPSLRGVMIAAFAAAYMSTVGTQLNWGASYLVNDFYKRFLVKDERRASTTCASRRWRPC